MHAHTGECNVSLQRDNVCQLSFISDFHKVIISIYFAKKLQVCIINKQWKSIKLLFSYFFSYVAPGCHRDWINGLWWHGKVLRQNFRSCSVRRDAKQHWFGTHSADAPFLFTFQPLHPGIKVNPSRGAAKLLGLGNVKDRGGNVILGPRHHPEWTIVILVSISNQRHTRCPQEIRLSIWLVTDNTSCVLMSAY